MNDVDPEDKSHVEGEIKVKEKGNFFCFVENIKNFSLLSFIGFQGL